MLKKTPEMNLICAAEILKYHGLILTKKLSKPERYWAVNQLINE